MWSNTDERLQRGPPFVLAVEVALGVQSLDVGDSNLCAVQHYPAVWERFEALWQGLLVLGCGWDVVLQHANIEDIIQRTGYGGEYVCHRACATVKSCGKIYMAKILF